KRRSPHFFSFTNVNHQAQIGVSGATRQVAKRTGSLGDLSRCTRTTRCENAGMIDPTVLDRIGNTPLVRLDRVAAGLPVPVFGKCEFLNPGGSVKDRIALAVVNDAEERGVLRPGMTLVEATAGNTGVGLALVAAIRGYKL